MPSVIEAIGLTKFYGTRRGVEDIDLRVEQGDVFGFLGPNGAGKTTTIRMMLDHIRPTRGSLTIFGKEPRTNGPKLRRRIGYLPGELPLWEQMTAQETLEFFARLRGGVDWAYVRRLAERFQVELAAPVHTLSRGNRQKIGVISAFMHQPELLVLDEPSGGLDPLMQQEFNGLVTEANKDGATVFLSSHILPEVEHLATRVAIIREGGLVTVQQVNALKQRSLRTLHVTFTRPVPRDVLAGVPGVRDFAVDGTSMKANVEVPMDAVIKALARFSVNDVTVHEPTLEDVFLAFYREKADAQAS